ncbi:hypothetical protein IFR09_25980 [Pseudomonas syringae]|nr:hypothetical protein [Pseudomonas syringae]MBD8790814.1 hypothetical protein [Pseudomonas syringae]MBD8802051.1 hypothetical protein [Pseudomonas syringae]MBD8814617.1 hypothetical protein [Pseudomonas syringae]
MTASKTRRNLAEAQRVRIEYRLQKARRIAEIGDDLADPVIDATWLADPADGTLIGQLVKEQDLPVSVSAWASLPLPGYKDTVRLQWAPGATPTEDDYQEVASIIVEGPVGPGIFPLQLKVPNARLKPDGPYSLRYVVKGWNGGSSISRRVNVICDILPPYGHEAPCPMTLPFDELTDDVLTTYPNGIPGTLPAYTDMQEGDKVAFYWVTTPLPDDADDLPEPVGYIDVLPDQLVVYPVDMLKQSQDKDYYAFYLLFDKAGNRSPLSEYDKVDVALGALPSNLQDPSVPLADDCVLDLPDAREGISVQIEAFDGRKTTDRIELTWGDEVLSSFEIGPSPSFPLDIAVPSETLRRAYDFTAGGEQATNVSYRVLRGAKPSGVKAISVNVDFSYIGPDPVPDPDPDWPDPVNGQLTLARVFGKTSQVENSLARADANQDADLKFELYTPLAKDEEIDFFWANAEVPEARYVVKDTDTSGKEISVEIPWSYIANAGNHPALLVHYRIHAPGSENYQSSPMTLVNVDAITVVPEKPAFEGLHNNSIINCDSLYADPANPATGEPAVRVKVPDLSRYQLQDGDKVTLMWRAVEGFIGEVEVPGTAKSTEITLGGATPVTGFVWLVQPYETHLLPVYSEVKYGRGRASYSFIASDSGEELTSEVAEATVALFVPGGACPIVSTP